jgi:hypothetical protein
MESESDYQKFFCACCRDEKEGFVFWGDNDEKFCSPFCRRRAKEARQAEIDQQEMAEEADGIHHPAGPPAGNR